MKWRDLPFLLVLLAGASGFSYLLYQHWFGPLSPTARQPVGDLVETTLTIQRQFADSTLWRPILVGNQLFAFDKIRTNEGSQATVRLLDGTVFTVQAQSLVVLSWSEGRPLLSLEEGDIKVTADGEFQVQVGENLVILPEGTAQISNDESGLEVSSETGTVKVRVGNEERIIDTDSILNVGSSGVVESVRGWRALFPTQGSQYYIHGDSQEVEFKQSVLEGFQITSSLIKNPSGEIFPLSENNRENWTPGTWFWTVKTEKDREVKEETLRFDIIKVPIPRLATPPDGMLYSFLDTPQPVLLSWEALPMTQTYRVSISKNSDLSEPQLEMMTQSSSLNLSNLAEGTWYWGVEPVFARDVLGSPAERETRTFQISRVSLDFEPQIILPSADESFSLVDVAEEGIVFQWKVPVDGLDTELSIFSDETRTLLVERFLGKSVLTAFFEFKPGTYYYTLRSRASENRYSRSSLGSFKIREQATNPQWLEPRPGTVAILDPANPLKFTWDKGGAPILILQYTQDSTWGIFEALPRSQSDTVEFMPPRSGQWFFRLRGIQNNGQFLGFSEVLTLQLNPLPQGPLILTPLENRVFTFVDAVPLTATWKLDGSGRIDWELTGPDGFSKKGSGENLESVELDPEKWPDGKYIWKVSLIYAPDKPPLVSERGFSLVTLTRLRAPSGLQPGGNLVLNMDSGDTFRLSWIELNEAQFYEVIIRGPGNRVLLSRQGIRDNFLDIETNLLLQEGTYQWQVRAIRFREGVEDISSWTTARFELTLPVLTVPEVTAPDVIYVE